MTGDGETGPRDLVANLMARALADPGTQAAADQLRASDDQMLAAAGLPPWTDEEWAGRLLVILVERARLILGGGQS